MDKFEAISIFCLHCYVWIVLFVEIRNHFIEPFGLKENSFCFSMLLQYYWRSFILYPFSFLFILAKGRKSFSFKWRIYFRLENCNLFGLNWNCMLKLLKIFSWKTFFLDYIKTEKHTKQKYLENETFVTLKTHWINRKLWRKKWEIINNLFYVLFHILSIYWLYKLYWVSWYK